VGVRRFAAPAPKPVWFGWAGLWTSRSLRLIEEAEAVDPAEDNRENDDAGQPPASMVDPVLTEQVLEPKPA
jgi:hypothetical protein